MENIKTIAATLSALTLGLALSACDGSGKAPAVQTGQLVDAAVQGATYKAMPSELSGVTDANGNYQYKLGDTVVFSFGNIVFPEVIATGTVTPQVLAGTASDDFDSQTVKNIARFLQSLDANGDPSDGIVIDPAKVEGVDNIDFTQDAADFEDDFKAAFPTDSLITTEDAIAHLECELIEKNCKTPPADDALPDALAGKSFDLYADSNTQGSPYYDGQQLTFAISTEGVMTITEDVRRSAKSSPSRLGPIDITINSYEKVGEEYKWVDADAGLSYTASLFEGALNEINVNQASDSALVAQFTTTNPCNVTKSVPAKSSVAASGCNF